MILGGSRGDYINQIRDIHECDVRTSNVPKPPNESDLNNESAGRCIQQTNKSLPSGHEN